MTPENPRKPMPSPSEGLPPFSNSQEGNAPPTFEPTPPKNRNANIDEPLLNGNPDEQPLNAKPIKPEDNYLKNRAEKGNRTDFDAAMKAVPDTDPVPGDEAEPDNQPQ